MIRKATLSDLTLIDEIKQETLKNPIGQDFLANELSSNQFAEILVYEIENKVVAFLYYRLVDGCCDIVEVAVRKKYQHQGLATTLFNHLFDMIKANQPASVVLEVRETNATAISFYQSLGFKIVLKKTRYYQNEDGYVMLKEFK